MVCSVCGNYNPPGATSCLRCGSQAVYPLPGSPAASGFGPGARLYQLGGLATALTIFLALEAALWISSLSYSLATSGQGPATDHLQASPELALLVLALVVTPVALFLTWFYQARMNAGLSAWPQRHAPGWAIGSWFVPIIFLWFPYQIMADIWRASLPSQPQRGSSGAVLPGLWWACWLLAWFTGFRHTTTYSSTGGSSLTQGNYSLDFGGTVPSAAFAAVAAVALIVIVRKVSDAQRTAS